jgi:hypothetical protein
MRGGRIARRDRWFGLKKNQILVISGVEGKDEAGGNDIADRQEAEQAYDHWVSRGRPIAE